MGDVFCKKWKWVGVFFCKKKWTFPQCGVHYVQYQYFLFYILLILGVRTHATAPPAYRPAVCMCVCAWRHLLSA